MPLSMEFGNPVFHPGLNVTVRNGSAWAELAVPGAFLALNGVSERDSSSYPTGNSLLLGTEQFDTLKDIPVDILAFEQNPRCRNHEGLKAYLDETRPDGHGSEGYTLVFFWVDYR